MKITYLKLKDIIDIVHREQRKIIIEVDSTKMYDRELLRERYRSYLYLYKVINYVYNKKKYFNKHELYFTIKKNMINYNVKEPFYKILTRIEELN